MPNWNKILTEVEASNQVNALDRYAKLEQNLNRG